MTNTEIIRQVVDANCLTGNDQVWYLSI